MFYYLEGLVTHTEPYIAVIDCGGVGYLCHVTTMTQSRIKQGQKARLYTHLNVREHAFELYGYPRIQEPNCFFLLVVWSSDGRILPRSDKSCQDIASNMRSEPVELVVRAHSQPTDHFL